MTDSITEAEVLEFSDNVITRAQQMGSRFRGKVSETQMQTLEKKIDRIDKVRAIEVTERHAKTIAQNITHDARFITAREFRVTLLLDERDSLATIIAADSKYSESVARALNVKYDQLVAEAAFATVTVGKNKDGSKTFSQDGGLTVSAGGTGATYEKLLELQENFINNDVGTDMPVPMHLACTGVQHTDMMKEVELTSGDFNRDYNVEKGKIKNAAGFEITHFSGTNDDAIINLTGTTRKCIAWTPAGIEVGVAKDITIRMGERADLNYSKQIQACLFMGAMRNDGKLVQAMEADEA